MTHIARGLDSDGALLLDIVVNGHILQLPSHADISIKVKKKKKWSEIDCLAFGGFIYHINLDSKKVDTLCKM